MANSTLPQRSAAPATWEMILLFISRSSSLCASSGTALDILFNVNDSPRTYDMSIVTPQMFLRFYLQNIRLQGTVLFDR
jgi:hypothetical protein